MAAGWGGGSLAGRVSSLDDASAHPWEFVQQVHNSILRPPSLPTVENPNDALHVFLPRREQHDHLTQFIKQLQGQPGLRACTGVRGRMGRSLIGNERLQHAGEVLDALLLLHGGWAPTRGAHDIRDALLDELAVGGVEVVEDILVRCE